VNLFLRDHSGRSRLSHALFRDTFNRDTDVQFSDTNKFIIAGAFPIWIRPTPSMNSLADHCAKHLNWPKLLTADEARRIAANIAKLPDS